MMADAGASDLGQGGLTSPEVHLLQALVPLSQERRRWVRVQRTVRKRRAADRSLVLPGPRQAAQHLCCFRPDSCSRVAHQLLRC